MLHGRNMVSIWFFIGVLLLIYGVLIMSAGIYELYNPPEHPVAMSYLHAGVWWGAVLIIIGAFYSYHFAPKRQK